MHSKMAQTYIFHRITIINNPKSGYKETDFSATITIFAHKIAKNLITMRRTQ